MIRLTDGAIIGTASEFNQIANEALEDGHGIRVDATVSLVVNGSDWGIALTDNRLRLIHGDARFQEILREDIRILQQKLTAVSNPKVILRNSRSRSE